MLSSVPCHNYLSEILPKKEEFIEFTHYYNKLLDTITGFRILKTHLLISDFEDSNIRRRKMIFRNYLVWFLKSRASLHIMLGEVNN